MATNKGKQGGRVTAKGTQPPAKKPRTGPAGPSAPRAGGGRAAEPAADAAAGPNRQMRRAGMNLEQQAPDTKRIKLIFGIGGAVAALMVIGFIVAFGLSGTWIGILGMVAGVAEGYAVAIQKQPFAARGRQVAIGLVVVGAVLAVLGATNVLPIHWWALSLVGFGVGAFFVEMFNQQMVEPVGPPASAVALLKRSGAQVLDVPSSGGAVWATSDGRVRVIIGATLDPKSTNDDVTADRNVRRSRQKAQMLQRRLAAIGAEEGLICVIDSAVTTVRDGDDIICSSAGLTKALSR